MEPILYLQQFPSGYGPITQVFKKSFPLQLLLTQNHHSTHTELWIFTMSVSYYRLLLVRAPIDGNKEDYDDKMNNIKETFASMLDKLI